MPRSDMFRSPKGRLTLLISAVVLSLGLFAPPASAQQQEGLVNVYVSDIDVLVQVPIGVAANVCPAVNAAIIAQEFRQTGETVCDAESTQFTRGQQQAFGIDSNGNGAPQQQGLVNVWISDIGVLAQVPIGVAANVCPAVNAAIIAQEFRQTGETVCDAESTQFTRGQQQAFGIS